MLMERGIQQDKAGYADARNAMHHLFWARADDPKRIFDILMPNGLRLW